MGVKRVKTGIKGLDEMLGGGLYAGSTTVVKGAPGTGKTSFGIEFVARGIEKENQPGMIVSFEEFAEQLYRDASSIGFDLKKHEDKGMLKTILTSPDVFASEMVKPGGKFDQVVVEGKVERAVVDSITHLEGLADDEKSLRDLMYSFVNGLRRYGMTTVLTQEAERIIGEADISDSRISHIADNLILLRYVEIESALKKALVVVKERGSDHDKGIREFEITDHGIVIKLPFKYQEGIFTGTPRRVAKEMAKFFKE